MATVKIKLRPSSVEGKAGVIFYQITHNRKTQHITTRLRVQPFDWNADKEKLEPSAPNRSMILYMSFRNWHTFHGFYYTFILLPERCGQYKVQIPVQQCRKSYYRPLPTTVYIADRTASVLCVAREIF